MLKNAIKVDKKIKPIHFSKRTVVSLVEGDPYFVCFGMNKAYSCKLLEVLPHGTDTAEVRIEYPDGGTAQLFADEIGRTPEEAVINQKTS
jgi:hypothetical protein